MHSNPPEELDSSPPYHVRGASAVPAFALPNPAEKNDNTGNPIETAALRKHPFKGRPIECNRIESRSTDESISPRIAGMAPPRHRSRLPGCFRSASAKP